jgi:DNA-binding Lrp family transcriptional regulator
MIEQEQNDKLIYLLQAGLPFCSRPFNKIAEELKISEADVVAEIKKLQKSGLIRRFGGVFNSAGLGFKSCLCAVNVPEYDIERVNSLISPDSGVTHCYLRNSEPNLWFTYTAHQDQYEKGLNKFRRKLCPRHLLVLPAIKKFKVQVIFNKTGSDTPMQPIVQELKVPQLSQKEKALVSYLQGNVPVKIEFFKNIADELNYNEEELLKLLAEWKNAGVLKRVSAVIRHHKFGFNGNAMCAWNVPENEIQKVGEAVAELSEVSHCYQRVMDPEFPYNFYAMIHAENEKEVQRKFQKLSQMEHLNNGRMLLSIRELKKTSPVYFKPKMQFSVYVMSLIVILLVAGAFPLIGATEVYKSGFMIVMLGLLSLLTLKCCIKQKFKLKKAGFYLSHLGVIVILAGAFLGYLKSEKVSLGVYVGESYVTNQIYDQQHPGRSIPLDFSFYITDFNVEKFDPSFTLYKKDESAPSGFKMLETYNIHNGRINIKETGSDISVSQLKDPQGNWLPHFFIDTDYMLFKNKAGDKWYSAEFNIKGEKRKFLLAVNHPVSYKKWRFYLMSFGRDVRGEYVIMTARRDPGRNIVITGIWMLMAGIFMICFLRKNRGIE